jgi:hypothetical protein
MSEQNKNRPELIFEKMDAMNMDYKVSVKAVLFSLKTKNASVKV